MTQNIFNHLMTLFSFSSKFVSVTKQLLVLFSVLVIKSFNLGLCPSRI